jgi:hypothetical protein
MKQKLTFILGAFTGLLVAASLSGQFTHGEPAASGPVVRVDESKMQISYANAYRIHTTADEVVFDFGLNMPNPNGDPKSGELLFDVTNRLVINYGNVKKLSGSLDNLVKQYEQRFGPIPPLNGDNK